MRPRPRYRSWLNLSTQQLRLRNLIKIEGFKVKCSNTCAVIYYTLHKSIDEDAFYVSELLPLCQKLKWPEIICSKSCKSNDESVCVKVWARFLMSNSDTDHDNNGSKAPDELTSSALNQKLNITANRLTPMNFMDKILFTWGVYFSGLMPLFPKDIKCRDNSLLFYINGDCFTSAENIISNLSVFKDSINAGQLPDYQARRHFTLQNVITHLHPSETEVRYSMNIRYINLYFKSSDLRKSYNLNQLLKLQEIQRRQLQKIKARKNLTLDIQQQSLYCITKDQLSSHHKLLLTNSSYCRHRQRLSMGRALSELFSEHQQISPQSLLYAQNLKKQVEALRSKQRFLQSEYQTYSLRIAQQRDRLTSLTDVRKQAETSLTSRHCQLRVEKKRLNRYYQELSCLLQKKEEILRDRERRTFTLCVGLREIYPIEEDSNGFKIINNVRFPGINAFNDVTRFSTDAKSTYNILPMTISVSLGYIAHLVQMIALILSRPLRNAIIHQGSRSRIVDIAKNIPCVRSEYPLYSRSTIQSKSVEYAVFLLNQNVAQLCYEIAGIRCDTRLTLDNVCQIFIYLAVQHNLEEKRNSTTLMYQNKELAFNYSNFKHVNGFGNIAGSLLSKSHSSVDMSHIPDPLTMALRGNSFFKLSNSIPISIEGACIDRQRVSRSVGSYSDSEDDLKDIRDRGCSNSDSIIATSSNNI